MNPDERHTIPLKKGKSRRRWILLSVLVALMALALYQGWGSAQKKSGKGRAFRADIPVQTSPVVRKDLTYSLKATGDIAPLMQVDLFPKVSGYLERINVNLGDLVRPGQVIANVDQIEFLHKMKEAEAKVAHAKAQLSEMEAGSRPEELRQAEEAVKQAQSRFENARLQRERIEALYKRQVISKKEADLAEMDSSVAEAQLAASQQNLKLVREGVRQEVRMASQAKLKEMEAILAQEQIRLQNTQIIAPFHGEVARKYVDHGALVSPSTPIVTIVHTATLKIVANVLEKDIPLLKPGMKAKIQAETYPEKIFEGKVAQINSALDLSTRTLQVEFYIPNSQRMLKPGMFAKLEVLLSEKRQALVVPREAMIQAEGEPSVFVVEGNQALRRPIAIGFEQDQMVEVLKGLKEGEKVVVKGQYSIKDRSTVEVIEGEAKN